MEKIKYKKGRHVVCFWDSLNGELAEDKLNEYCKNEHVYPLQIDVVDMRDDKQPGAISACNIL